MHGELHSRVSSHLKTSTPSSCLHQTLSHHSPCQDLLFSLSSVQHVCTTCVKERQTLCVRLERALNHFELSMSQVHSMFLASHGFNHVSPLTALVLWILLGGSPASRSTGVLLLKESCCGHLSFCYSFMQMIPECVLQSIWLSSHCRQIIYKWLDQICCVQTTALYWPICVGCCGNDMGLRGCVVTRYSNTETRAVSPQKFDFMGFLLFRHKATNLVLTKTGFGAVDVNKVMYTRIWISYIYRCIEHISMTYSEMCSICDVFRCLTCDYSRIILHVF